MKIISKITAVLAQDPPKNATDEEKNAFTAETVVLRPSDLPVTVPEWVTSNDHYLLLVKDGSVIELKEGEGFKVAGLGAFSTELLTAELMKRGAANGDVPDSALIAELRQRGYTVTKSVGSPEQPGSQGDGLDWTRGGDGSSYPDPVKVAADTKAAQAAAKARSSDPSRQGKRTDTVDQGAGGPDTTGATGAVQGTNDKSREQEEADKANLENAGKAGTATGTPSGAQAPNSGDARTARPNATGA